MRLEGYTPDIYAEKNSTFVLILSPKDMGWNAERVGKER